MAINAARAPQGGRGQWTVNCTGTQSFITFSYICWIKKLCILLSNFDGWLLTSRVQTFKLLILSTENGVLSLYIPAKGALTARKANKFHCSRHILMV